MSAEWTGSTDCPTSRPVQDCLGGRAQRRARLREVGARTAALLVDWAPQGATVFSSAGSGESVVGMILLYIQQLSPWPPGGEDRRA